MPVTQHACNAVHPNVLINIPPTHAEGAVEHWAGSESSLCAGSKRRPLQHLGLRQALWLQFREGHNAQAVREVRREVRGVRLVREAGDAGAGVRRVQLRVILRPLRHLRWHRHLRRLLLQGFPCWCTCGFYV